MAPDLGVGSDAPGAEGDHWQRGLQTAADACQEVDDAVAATIPTVVDGGSACRLIAAIFRLLNCWVAL